MIFGWLRDERYRVVIALLKMIDRKVTTLMVDMSNLETAVDGITTEVNAAITALDELAAKVGNGDTVTQTEIDGITASLRGATDALTAAVSTDNPPPV